MCGDLWKTRELLDNEFVEENIFVVEMTVLCALCDVQMFHFMPWKRSKFFMLSEGFPSWNVMGILLSIKTLQSFVCVIAPAPLATSPAWHPAG